MGSIFGFDDEKPEPKQEQKREVIRRENPPPRTPADDRRQNAEILAQIPPQNLQAEKAVLASCLLSNDVIDDVAIIVKAEHFYFDVHSSVYVAIVALYQANKKVDAITLAEQLETTRNLEDIGGVPYILELLEAVPHAAHAVYYAEIVVEEYRRRATIGVGMDLTHKGRDTGEPIRDVIAKADQQLVDIANIGFANRERTIADCLSTAITAINARINQHGIAGVSTGFSDLDQLTGGMCESNLIVIGARPSIGKTALMLNIAYAVAKGGKFVAIYSLEQSSLQLAERFLVAESALDGHNVRAGILAEADRFALMEGASRLGVMPISICDTDSMSVSEIAASARRMKRRNKLAAVFVDYLQIIRAEEGKLPREQQISLQTKRLKGLAKQLEVPVIVLSQLNRQVESREDKRPRLSDLRESGSIEQDADMILLLHRADAYNPDEKPGEAEVIVAKNRDGRTGVCTLVYRKHCFRFETISRQEGPAFPGGF